MEEAEEAVRDKFEAKESGSPLFTLRNIRDIAVVLGIFVIAWKLLQSNWDISIDKFSFTDLLALVLALFSVWLSVLFYFKADEASGRFYDNSYKFTSDISVILGRIEAGFGERLRHLDEGYTGMRDAFGRLTAKGVRAEKEEEVVEEKEAELRGIIDDLANRAAMGDQEKGALRDHLSRVSAELEHAKNELRRLHNRAPPAARDESEVSPRDILRYVANQVLHTAEHAISAESLSTDDVRELFIRGSAELNADLFAVLRRVGITAANGRTLTSMGVTRFREELDSLRKS